MRERERELGEGSQVMEGRVGGWGQGWDVAASPCAQDTHRRCTSGPSASVARTVRGWVTWQGKSMCPRLTVVGHVAQPRTVRRIGADCPPLPKSVD